MHVYFIRHGETDYNRRSVHQHADVPLNDRGRLQIQRTGRALKKLPITKLITSDLLRTEQSSEIISEIIDLPAEKNVLFREVRRPTELHGHKHLSLTTLRIGARMLQKLNDPQWHYSDEENLEDVRLRTEEAVTFLKALGREHEHVAIVSHAFIINIFLKYMCEFGKVRVIDYLRTTVATKNLANGSISTVVYKDDDNPTTCDWMCIKVNERDHLTHR